MGILYINILDKPGKYVEEQFLLEREAILLVALPIRTVVKVT